MGWFNRQAQLNEESERERLSRLSEKELLIELILQLEKVNRKCDDISSKIVIWSNWNVKDTIQFGVYACSAENSSFKATFTDMEITECKWLAHDGQQPDEE